MVVCPELSRPPRFERQLEQTALSGDLRKNTRERLPHFRDDHGSIAPYAYQVRLVLSDRHAFRGLTNLYEEAGLILRPSSNVPMTVVVRSFFHPNRPGTFR